MNNRAPFRADVVGSLLRPHALATAREAYRAKTIDANQLRDVEDRCIREAVEKQEALGLKAVTDGEFRRSWWHLDFLGGLEGVERVAGAGRNFSGVQTRGERVTVTGKVAVLGSLGLWDNFFSYYHRKLLRHEGAMAEAERMRAETMTWRRGR